MQVLFVFCRLGAAPGASLNSAQLQAAALDLAQLQLASLNSASLAGAVLDEAQLEGATFVNVFVWRADARKASWKGTRLVSPTTGASESLCAKDNGCKWSATSFERVKYRVAVSFPKDYAQEVLELGPKYKERWDMRWKGIGRIETLDPTKALEGEEEMAKEWADHERSTPAPEVYGKSLAEQWRKTGCADGAPYVLRALLRKLDDPKILPFAPDSPEGRSSPLPSWIRSTAPGAREAQACARITPPAPSQ